MRVTAMLPDILRDFPNVVFFAPKVAFEQDNWFTRLLRNQTPLLIQRRLSRLGVEMMVVPLRLELYGR